MAVPDNKGLALYVGQPWKPEDFGLRASYTEGKRFLRDFTGLFFT